MSRRVALIFGVSGQDGAYLAHLLLEKGYEVHGTSRDIEANPMPNLSRLGVRDRVHCHSVAPLDFRSVLQVIRNTSPTEIYNLAGQSSVGLSFSQPVETLQSTLLATVNILESMRIERIDARLYNASSSECFGTSASGPLSETSAFRPQSPYGVGKSAAHWAVANYRESYGMYACSGILFNHESPLRPSRFVTQKIVKGAVDIAQGKAERITLGPLDIVRDWGWAPDYVHAMWRMLQIASPEDFVICTGTGHKLRDFVEATFRALNLDWHDHVHVDPALFRPADPKVIVGDPNRAKERLHWAATVQFDDIVRRMVLAELNRRAGEERPEKLL